MFFPLKDVNPTERFPVVTIALIVVNAVVFLYQLSLGTQAHAFVAAFGAIPYEIVNGEDLIGLDISERFQHETGPPILFLTLFSSMFMHGGFMHIIGNMLYLWIFGNNIEDMIGPVKFLFFYLVCGLLASGAHIIFQPDSTIPTIGASGAVSGVLGAYLLAYPKARVMTLVFIVIFIRIVMLPASVLLIFWFAMQIFSSIGSLGAGGGGVAWFAHIGGFIAGIGLIKLMAGNRIQWLRNHPSPNHVERPFDR